MLGNALRKEKERERRGWEKDMDQTWAEENKRVKEKAKMEEKAQASKGKEKGEALCMAHAGRAEARISRKIVPRVGRCLV